MALSPTGLTIGSPEVVSCWLDCGVTEAILRKKGQLCERLVRRAHAAASSRDSHARETVIDTTYEAPDQIVSLIARALGVADSTLRK